MSLDTSVGRDSDDMASVPPVEQSPVPMSRNNVGSRWIAVVLDREMHKDYNGEIYDGEPVVVIPDDDEDEEEDVEEEEYEEDEPTEMDMSIKPPEFAEEEPSEKRTAYQDHTLQIVDKSDLNLDHDDQHILWRMHKERIALTEDHVMWARKQNLYNETFNTESMADVLWSHQM